MESPEFQEGDYVLFWSKKKPEVEYIGRIIIDEWGIQNLVRPDRDVHSLASIRELSRLNESNGLTVSPHFDFTLTGNIEVKKITEKEYFYRRLKGGSND